MSSDLIAFLNARLDEDEDAARESCYEGQRWLTEEEGVYRWPDDELVHSADRKADARHIARHDPAAVLRDVAAKRAILAEHKHVAADTPDFRKGPEPFGCFTCDYVPDEGTYGDGWCPTVRILAAIWSDHPDYDPEWRLTP